MRRFSLVILCVLSCSSVLAKNPNSLTSKEAVEGYELLFDGKTLDGWVGATDGYEAENGSIVCRKGGNLYTDKDYADFSFRFDFKLPENGNNGVGIRAAVKGNAAFAGGMEVQVLDDSGEKYKGKLKPYQYHGSIYGLVPAKQGHLKPVGKWNSQEIICQGTQVTVILNGTVIVDADLAEIKVPMDGRDHAGMLREKGRIGFLGHGYPVEFRTIRVKNLK